MMYTHKYVTRPTVASLGGTGGTGASASAKKKASLVMSPKGAPKHSLLRALSRQQQRCKKSKPKSAIKAKGKVGSRSSSKGCPVMKENIATAAKAPIVRTDEIPERDNAADYVLKERFNNENVRSLVSEQKCNDYIGAKVAYNKRLSSSTPIHIPCPDEDDQSLTTSSSLHTVCDAQPHAMNSAEYIPAAPPLNTGPRLLDGSVQFVPNPAVVKSFRPQPCMCQALQSEYNYRQAPDKVSSFQQDILMKAAQAQQQQQQQQQGAMRDLPPAHLQVNTAMPRQQHISHTTDTHYTSTSNQGSRREKSVIETHQSHQSRDIEKPPPNYVPIRSQQPLQDRADTRSTVAASGTSCDGYISPRATIVPERNSCDYHMRPTSPRRSTQNQFTDTAYQVGGGGARTDSPPRELPFHTFDARLHSAASHPPRPDDVTESTFGDLYRPITPLKLRQAWTEGNPDLPKETARVSFYSDAAAGSERPVQYAACTQTDGARKAILTSQHDQATSPLKHPAAKANDEECDIPETVANPTSLTATVQGHLQKVKQLCREVKRDKNGGDKVKQLSRALEERCQGLEPSAWQAEWDMALQPLRKENTQLRRRVRILQQQLKERGNSRGTDSPPPLDTNLELVKLQLISTKLESRLREELESSDRLRTRLAVSQQENAALRDEKQQVVRLIANKQNDESRRGAEERREQRVEQHQMGEEIQQLERDKQMLTIELAAREKEVQKMQQLVSGLQESMRTLLQGLSRPSMSPAEASRSLANIMDNMGSSNTATRVQGPPPPVSKLTKANVMSLPKEQPLKPRAIQAARDEVESVTSLGSGDEDTLEEDVDNQQEATESAATTVARKASPNTVATDDPTEYLLPMGMSPLTRAHSKNSPGGAGSATVKELLTPIAEQMNKVNNGNKGQTPATSSAAVRALNFDNEDNGNAPSKRKVESMKSSSYTRKETVGAAAAVAAETSITSTEQSRYSVTDYFAKYRSTGRGSSDDSVFKSLQQQPADTPNTGHRGSSSSSGGGVGGVGGETSEPPTSDSKQSTARESTTAARRAVHSTTSQERMFGGTILDTSLSSIGETETGTGETEMEGEMTELGAAVAAAAAATTVDDGQLTTTCGGSVTSMDDRLFQQGLANLDANIAKLQLALREDAFSQSSTVGSLDS